MLMCKNTPVYDIENEKTLNYNLLPGLMQQKHDSTEIKGHHIRTGSTYAH